MKGARIVREQALKDELVVMIADVAVMATERHLEVVDLLKGHDLKISGLQAGFDQLKADIAGVDAKIEHVKADVASVKADVAQVKADVSSIKTKMLTSEMAADKRHEELLDAIRGTRSVSNRVFAL